MMHPRAIQNNACQYYPLDTEWTFALCQEPLEVDVTWVTRRNKAVADYAKDQNINIFNGPTVCLKEIDCQQKSLNFELGDFFDLVMLAVVEPDPLNPPEAVAISVLLHDIDGNVLLAQRTNNVAIGRGIMSTTVTGALEPRDFLTEKGLLSERLDPFCRCALREIEEELGINLQPEQLTTKGLFIGAIKRQPVVLIDGVLDASFTMDNHEFPLQGESSDGVQEVQRLYSVAPNEVAEFARQHEMTEAAKYHLCLGAV